MASVITVAFENWKAQEAASGKAVLLDEFVFANVPNLDPTQPIDRNEKLPPANQIVHRQAVNKAGLASENAVAYSVTLGADVGNFDFNWIGLLNKASGTVAMITHAPTQKKLKTQNGQQGNVLTRSFILEFQGAAEETQIKTSAETWQIDFTARLSGIDEMQRLINVDSYGAAAFFNDGFEVTRSGEQFTVKKGLGYVGGLRGELAQNQILNGLRNTKVYADFSYQGNIVSQWNTVIKITAAATLNNYVDTAGFTHQVFAIASIDANGNVKDLRPMGILNNDKIISLLKNKQDKGNYASGLHFAINETTKATYIYSPENNKGLVIHESGEVGFYDFSTDQYIWRFNNSGEMTYGLIPIENGGTGATTAKKARENLGVISSDEIKLLLDKKVDVNSAANLLRLTTDSSDALRMRSDDYSAILHQNNQELFILLTNKGDRDGKYNALRPFRVNLDSGRVTLDDVIINNLALSDFRIFNERYLGISNPATSAKKLENSCRIAGHAFDGNGNDIKITSSDIKANSYVFYFQENQSWSVPSEFVGRLAKVTVYGAGGGGSSKTMNGVRRAGMMGGFGGLAEKLIRLGSTHNIVVGIGGKGGAYSASSDAGTGGGNGGTSSFDSISATGGNGAASQASVGGSTADATHGYGAGGDINIVGGGAVGGSAGQNNDAVDGSGRKGGDGYIVVEVLS